MNLVELRSQLITHEGLQLKPYRCPAGKLTIGVGRNIEDNGITKEEAFALLDHDIQRSIADLDRAFPWWRNMNDRRQNVLIDMCFNMGISRLSGFKKTLGLMEAGKYVDAGVEMMNSDWARQVGQRAVTLSRMIVEG